jgi:hypothetical protein
LIGDGTLKLKGAASAFETLKFSGTSNADPTLLGGINWAHGDTVMNSAPVAGGPIGWVYANNSGSLEWLAFGEIDH